MFTFYCDTHREERRQGPAPSSAAPGSAMAPACSVCSERMFWVPNGGAVPPKKEKA